MKDDAVKESRQYQAMRANRDLWVRRHAALERLIKTIKAQVEQFEAGVDHKGEWTFECSADDLMAIGWVRVLCDLPFEPDFYRVTEFGR